MFKRILIIVFFPLFAFGFEISPWLSPIAEFEFRPSYSYRYYPNVSQAKNPSNYSSHDHLIDLNLGVNIWPNWDIQFQSDFSSTRRLSWGTQLIGVQVRYLVLDDVAGDPVSFTIGGQCYYVPTRNMRDVSSPYHAQGNFELGAAVGKEIDSTFNWLYRFYGFLGVGIANRGSPWVRPELSFAFNYQNRHRFEVFTEGYFGFGHRKTVNVRRFNGYAKIRHQSIDLGASYHYEFEIWGFLGFQYSYRLYAKSFPENTSIIRVEYRLPFSLL